MSAGVLCSQCDVIFERDRYSNPKYWRAKSEQLRLMGSAANGFGDQLDQSFAVILRLSNFV